MHTGEFTREGRESSANERLRELVEASGLTQAQALAKFNEAMGLRPIALSTWKGYFVTPQSSRWRTFSAAFLAHAARVFARRRNRDWLV